MIDGHSIPCWLRITWITLSPDPEELLLYPKPEGKTVKLPEILWRRAPSVPDRHFYHLFLAGKSLKEMMSILHLSSEKNARRRLDLLEEAGWITHRQRKRWKTETFRKLRASSSKLVSHPLYPKLYNRIGRLIMKGDYTISELMEITSSPRSTVTRYAARWRKRNAEYLRDSLREED